MQGVLVRVICIGMCLIGVAACELAGPGRGDVDVAERTYPEAFAYAPMALEVLTAGTPAPGTYNLDVFVVNISRCPDGWKCILPDGIIVAERRNAQRYEEQFRLTVMPPDQFMRYARYLISIRVEDTGIDDPDTGQPIRRVRMLGYTRKR